MSRPIDIVVAGLGNPEPEYATTRHNANAIALAQGQTTENPPRFYRRLDLSADIRDTIFTSTSENGSITNSFRVILIKPLTAMNESGFAVQKVLQHFAVKETKKFIVVADDINTLPGTLMIQSGGDLAAMKGHKGLENIVSVIGTEFIRFRLGIGRPISKTTQISQWVLNPFEKENREMDLFGHLLHLTTQALYEYSNHKDLKKVKKKFAHARKLPNKLTEMNSLVFPVDTHGF
ncbi:peptidyl-tRNA hydrolase [Glomus cerebriforme]|uniref:Peptidyl-tRNA hydrolase n=1 Tax=Glomus cerebriforme TaxID=658196 RepID=A0A397TFH3_9GLOM|nr:peptidyl-tRNA hydrolase [Glomus cerebriforme]